MIKDLTELTSKTEQLKYKIIHSLDSSRIDMERLLTDENLYILIRRLVDAGMFTAFCTCENFPEVTFDKEELTTSIDEMFK